MNATDAESHKDDEPKGLAPGQFALLMLGLLTTGIGQSFIFAILPPLGREVGFDEIQINTIIAVSALVFSVSSPFWGRVADRIGRKPVLVIGIFGYAIGNLTFALTFEAGLQGLLVGTPLFITILVLRSAQSMVMSASNPGAAAYAADTSARRFRTRALARLGTATSLGMIAGPILAGLLAGFGLLFPLYVATALAGLAAIIIYKRLKPDTGHAGAQRSNKRLSIFDPRLRIYLFCSFGGFTGFSGIQQTLGFRLQDMLALSGSDTARYTGYCLMAAALCTFTMQMTVSQRYQGPPIVLIRWGVALLCAGALAIAVAGSFPLIMVGMAVMGTGLGLMVPSIAAAASLAVNPDEQGAAAGLVTACPAAGFVSGPLICGALYTVSPALSALGAAAVLIAVFVAALMTPKLAHFQ